VCLSLFWLLFFFPFFVFFSFTLFCPILWHRVNFWHVTSYSYAVGVCGTGCCVSICLFVCLRCIVATWCEIRLLLIANRKLHISWLSNDMRINDLGLPKVSTCYCRWTVRDRAQWTIVNVLFVKGCKFAVWFLLIKMVDRCGCIEVDPVTGMVINLRDLKHLIKVRFILSLC